MDKFIGKWILEENINFDDFLKYYQYGWIKRKLALSSNIDLTIQKTNKENRLLRIIDSTFLKTQEEYIFDGKFHKTPLNLEKYHLLENNQIVTEVKSDLFHWYETNTIKENKLIIQRKWFENGIEKTCSQIFTKQN